jgi:zona occludens toxin (predicted ATPase)
MTAGGLKQTTKTGDGIMNSRKTWRRNCVCLLSLVLLVLMTACAGKEAKSDAQAGSEAKPDAKAASVQDPPLVKPYRVIVVAEFETSAEIAKDYPNATQECQANTISALKEKKFYQAVESGKAAMARRDGTLLVKAKVSGMRIVSGHARMWGGAFTGSSFMEVDLTLIDAATNAVVREKKLSSANNPWAAAWVGGASDQSLPADTGRMLAEYVHSVMPK